MQIANTIYKYKLTVFCSFEKLSSSTLGVKEYIFMINKKIKSAVAIFTIIGMLGSVAFAANNSTFNQTINTGTLAADIKDSSRVTVASPSVSFSTKTFSFDCQSGGSASTGTLGSNTQRVYVTNPGGANNGWTLTIAPTSGATTLWQNGGSTENYDFNDAGGSGCTDGADGDTKGGQLTIDANAGTLNTDCGSCVATNVSKGSGTSFVQGTTDSVTLLSASAASDDYWRGYLVDAGMSQTIPGEQPVDSYSINMTLTSTAL